MIPSNATSILKSLISTKLNPLFSKLNGLLFSRKTPEAKKPVPADSKTADFIERYKKSTEEVKAIEESLRKLYQKDDLEQKQGLNNPVPTNQAIESSGKSEKSSGGNNNYLTRAPLSPVLEECSLDLSPKEITHEHVPTRIATSKKLTSGRSLITDYGGYQPDDPTLIRAQESLGVKDPDKRTERREVSTNSVPLSSLKMPQVPPERVPLSSLQKERESYLLKSNGEDEIKADISLVISKEGKEDLSTLQVPPDERREREQFGIDPSPSKSRRPVDDPRYNAYRMFKSLAYGLRNQASGKESGLASANHGAGTKIIQRSEAFNEVVPKSSLHEIVTKQVSPDLQQNHHP